METSRELEKRGISYTENELVTIKTEKGGIKKMSEKKKINWLGLVIEIVKAAVAFFAGTQVTI